MSAAEGSTFATAFLFDAFERDHAKTGRSLLEWVTSADYDPNALTEHFRSNVLANALVDFVLRRE